MGKEKNINDENYENNGFMSEEINVESDKVKADKGDKNVVEVSNVDESKFTTTIMEKGKTATEKTTLKSNNFAESGPEKFHEVSLEDKTSNKRIMFDIDEDENIRESFKKKLADDGDDDNGIKESYQPGKMEKILNIMLCRKDLVNQKLAERPVKFWDLFKYGNRLDTILVMFGLLLAAMCGICQPVFAIISGQLANTLLLMEIEDPEFLEQGIQACILFVIIGAFLVVIAFIQFCCFNIACTRITRRIRNAYLFSILRQNPAWFEKNHSGALNTKLNDNIDRIYDGIGDKLGLLTRNMVQYITGIIVALYINWQMTLPLLIFSPIITFAMAYSSRVN
uniref:ABC transmembrane type-1 domain-containing protein n=1 Tax=Panagrolaimus davidi TaxID=227884 RepID=A0A914PP68_9BILA